MPEAHKPQAALPEGRARGKLNAAMKTLKSIVGMVVWAVAATAADPKDQIAGAIKALGEQDNYSWTTKIELENASFTPGLMRGKTVKDGWTCLSQEIEGETTEAFLKAGKGVVKTSEGWKTEDELPTPTPGSFDRAAMVGRWLLNSRTPFEMLKLVRDKFGECKTGDEGTVVGELNEEGLKELATIGRRPRSGGAAPPAPKSGKANVKFWLKNGVPTKFVVTLHATFSRPDGQDREVGWTSTFELKEVGSTKVEAPEDVKKKLGS
jgi:hypothetical protein